MYKFTIKKFTKSDQTSVLQNNDISQKMTLISNPHAMCTFELYTYNLIEYYGIFATYFL